MQLAFPNWVVWCFALLCAVFVEIAGLIIIGSYIGVLAALTLIMLSMLVGIYLLRSQSPGIIERILIEVRAGRTPNRELAEGVMVVFGAVLLIVPGFFSDIIGLLLFIKSFRNRCLCHISKRVILSHMYKTSDWEEIKTINLDANDSHATAPKDSPWRRPWDDNKEQ